MDVMNLEFTRYNTAYRLYMVVSNVVTVSIAVYLVYAYQLFLTSLSGGQSPDPYSLPSLMMAWVALSVLTMIGTSLLYSAGEEMEHGGPSRRCCAAVAKTSVIFGEFLLLMLAVYVLFVDFSVQKAGSAELDARSRAKFESIGLIVAVYQLVKSFVACCVIPCCLVLFVAPAKDRPGGYGSGVYRGPVGLHGSGVYHGYN
jgi:hypothetical protein